MGIRFRIPLPPGPIDDTNDDGVNLQNHGGFNRRFIRARPLDVCFLGDSLTSMTQTMTEFESRQSVSYTSYHIDPWWRNHTMLLQLLGPIGFRQAESSARKVREVASVMACTVLIVLQILVFSVCMSKSAVWKCTHSVFMQTLYFK